MCQECGCGRTGSEVRIGAPGDEASSDSGHPLPTHGLHPHHDHVHGPSHPADASHAGPTQTLDLNRSLLEKNDRLAERNRGFFKAHQLLVLNVVSSPGSGKTTLIRETAARLRGRLRVGVIVGDLATDNDAARLREVGIPVVQITTGTVCHLDAEMITRAAEQLDLRQLDLLVIENVGNLVCPADYDLGESLRVVLLSTTEGEDKPLKYPPMFHSAHVALITKSDLGPIVGFDRDLALRHLHRISHHAEIIEVSAKTGDGMDAWLKYLVDRCPP